MTEPIIESVKQPKRKKRGPGAPLDRVLTPEAQNSVHRPWDSMRREPSRNLWGRVILKSVGNRPPASRKAGLVLLRAEYLL